MEKYMNTIFNQCIDSVAAHDCLSLISKFRNRTKLKESDADDIAVELFAGKLLSVYAAELRSIKEIQGTKTPDFWAKIDGIEIEFEVTNSREKEKQKELAKLNMSILSRLQRLKPSTAFRIKFTEEFQDPDLMYLEKEIRKSNSKGSIEIENKIRVEFANSMEELDEDASWQTEQYATPCSLVFDASFTLDSEISTSKQSADCRWVLSTQSYINSLSKKQDALQATKDKPFIVICDVTKLPGAFAWYDDTFESNRKFLSRFVSGVIITKRQITSSGCEILHKFKANIDAAFSLKSGNAIFSEKVQRILL